MCMPTDQYKVFDYLGTAGSIIDLGIFQDPFWKSIPVEFKNVEDLWLCFVLQRFGWRRKATLVGPKNLRKRRETEVMGVYDGDVYVNMTKIIRKNKNNFLAKNQKLVGSLKKRPGIEFLMNKLHGSDGSSGSWSEVGVHDQKTKFLKYLQERGFGCDKSDAGFAGRNVVVPGKVGVVSSRDQV